MNKSNKKAEIIRLLNPEAFMKAVSIKAEEDKNGNVDCYCYARDIYKALGYVVEWRDLVKVINKIKSEHGNDNAIKLSNMVTTGSGVKRKVEDYKLSMLACFILINIFYEGSPFYNQQK